MNDTARLAIGRPAPGFTLPADGGRTLSLAGLNGSAVVLYFYPKDDTSGCTREALDFTANLAEFAAVRTVVNGVSKDPVKSHDKFIEKHGIVVPWYRMRIAISASVMAPGSRNRCMADVTWASNAPLS